MLARTPTETTGTTTLRVESLQSGIYFLEVKNKTDNLLYRKQIIKE